MGVCVGVCVVCLFVCVNKCITQKYSLIKFLGSLIFFLFRCTFLFMVNIITTTEIFLRKIQWSTNKRSISDRSSETYNTAVLCPLKEYCQGALTSQPHWRSG